MTASWAAPAATAPVKALLGHVPGSKSMTSRALVLAALSGGPATVSGVPVSRDSALMVGALQTLGVNVELLDGSVWFTGTGDDGTLAFLGDQTVDCGLAGTVMRFVPPLAALAAGPVCFDGDPRARERPMGPMLDALRALGVVVDGSRLPFTVHGAGEVRGGDVVLDASASSQFVSGLLLAGSCYEQGVTVRHSGGLLPSRPHIAMTVEMLRMAGVPTQDGVEDGVGDRGPDTWRVPSWRPDARDWDIEPDLSNAAVFLAAAAVTGGEVAIRNWPDASVQPVAAVRGVLTAFGCTMSLRPSEDVDNLVVRGPARLRGVDLDLHEVGELAPLVAALAALADGPSRLRGIAHLRGHETDRIAALVTEINALGGQASELSDGLAIQPRALRADPARPWRAYADHRMATAGALLGLAVPGVQVDDIGCTAKTIPDFPGRWSALVSGSPSEVGPD